jgi:ribosomal protein L37AE/L43A
MIKMRIENKSHLPRRMILCPECGYEEVYYNYAPWQCQECGYTFGMVNRLAADIRVRKYYFRKGEIN